MYLIADGLAPPSADPSVHFGRPCGGTCRDRGFFGAHRRVPVTDQIQALADRDLVDRWQRLIAIRDDVNRALETARQGRRSGIRWARASRSPRAGDGTLLRRYHDDLPMLFIVSQVSLQVTEARRHAGHRRGPRRRLQVRWCWRTVDTISSSPDTDGLCERCVAALGDRKPHDRRA